MIVRPHDWSPWLRTCPDGLVLVEQRRCPRCDSTQAHTVGPYPWADDPGGPCLTREDVTPMQTIGRKAGKTAAQLEHLRDCSHPDDLEALKLDLAIYGACYLDGDGRRIPPADAPPVRAVRPLTEATPAALTDGPTGWRLDTEEPTP